MGDANGPRLEIRAALKPFELAPEADIRFLEDFVGVVPVRHDAEDVRIDPPLMLREQSDEFFAMTGNSCQLDFH